MFLIVTYHCNFEQNWREEDSIGCVCVWGGGGGGGGHPPTVRSPDVSDSIRFEGFFLICYV